MKKIIAFAFFILFLIPLSDGALRAIATAYNAANVAITGGTMDGVTIGQTTPEPATFNALSSGNLKILFRSASPSIASGFGTSPSVTAASNGTSNFCVLVGGGGTASTGVITMPTAANGWNCSPFTPAGAPQAAAITYAQATSTTSITLTNYTLSTAVALAWTSGETVCGQCSGY